MNYEKTEREKNGLSLLPVVERYIRGSGEEDEKVFDIRGSEIKRGWGL